MKKIIFILFILIATSAHAQTSGTINRLDQWSATTSPVNAITQRVFGKSLYFTGFTDGCLSLVSGILTSSGTACGAGGGGSSGGTWSTTTSQVANRLINYPNNATDIVTIGSNATTTAEFWYDPTALVGFLSGRFGIGTTSPGTALGVMGKAVIADDVTSSRYVATSTATSTFVGGIQSNIFNATSATASSTFANGINLTAGCFARNGVCLGLSNLSGNVSLTSQVTGVLPIANGGTASSTSLGGILAGNGTSAIKSVIIGTGLSFDGSTLTATGGSSASSTLLSDMNTFSTTGTTTFNANIKARYGLFGDSTPLNTDSTVGLEVWGNNNGAVQIGVGNRSTGNAAYGCVFLNNDKADSSLSHYGAICQNSSTYNDTTFGDLLSFPHQLSMETTDGSMTFVASSSTNPLSTFINFAIGGKNLTDEVFRITTSGISVGPTTSPNARFVITNPASDRIFWFESEASDTTPHVLTNTDRLGIATSSPWTTLSVNGIGAMDSIYTTNTTATSTFKGKIDANRLTSATLRITGLTNCNSSLTLKTDLYGNVICETDQTGAGGAVTGNGITGMMASWSSASNLIATSTIIGERVYATSTTATSTFLGSLAIGGATPDANFSVKGIGGKVMQIFTSASTKIIDIANDGIVTLLGAWNFGEATSLEIPNATSPTYGAAGIIALDTTANNLTFATSTTGHVVAAMGTTTLYAFTIASTSPDAINGGIIYLPEHPLAQAVTAISCFTDGGTSQVINVSNDAGSYDSNTVTCSTTRAQTAITTNSGYSAYGGIRLELGAKTGSWDYLTIRILGYRTSN